MSEAQRFIEAAAKLGREVLAKEAAEVDAAGRFPTRSLQALSEAGLLGLCVPVSHGGKGQGPRVFAEVVEQLAQHCASTAMVYVMHVTAAQAIASSTSLAEKDALLREIAAGRHLTTLAFSEKGSRSNFWLPVSKLEPKGNGYVTNAAKSWVTSAHHAHSYVSSAQRPGAASPLESTVYLIERGAPGVRVAGGFDGLGLRGNDSTPVSIEDHPVREGELISAHGKGIDTMLQVVLPWFALGTSAMAVGLCASSVGATAGHLSSTGMDSGTRLRDLPNLRARLAQMSIRTEQARALLGHAVGLVEQGAATAPLFVLQARASALEAALEVTDLGMKACGGAAFSRHLPLERAFRDARAGWVMAPTVDHLHDFIGKALTGLPLL